MDMESGLAIPREDAVAMFLGHWKLGEGDGRRGE
jgi:hypothetical protein